MQVQNIDAKNKLKFALGKVIKTYREKTWKSISQISAEIMMSKSVWRNIELGKSDVRSSTLWLICEALDVTPELVYLDARKLLGKNFCISEL